MYWNYRIIKKDHPDSSGASYYVHEVYYDEKRNIETWTANPVKPYGDDLAELREDIRYHLKAFHHPVLKEVDDQLVPDEEETVINEGHYSAALDRALVAIDYLNDFLGAHPVIRKTEALKDLFTAIDKKMGELYVELGKLAIEKEAM